MWSTTGRCIGTWLKVTLVLGLLVLVAGLVWGWRSGPFALAVLGAVLVELLAIRGLIREWAFDARGTWWWFG